MGIIMQRKKDNCKDVKLFCIVALVIGIIMSFIIGPWQIPDEATHLYAIGKSIKNEVFADNVIDNLGIERGRVEQNKEEVFEVRQLLDAMTREPDYSIKEMMPNGLKLSAIKYIPALCGMLVAVVLGLPAYWVMQFGELFSLFVYVYICAKALQVCPFKRNIVAIFMLIPMMMQGAGSISHDAIVVPLLYWIICYVFYLRYEKEKITAKDMILLIGAWLWVTVVKVPYTFIILLGLMLPLRKMQIQIAKITIDEKLIRKVRWIALAILVLVMGVGIYLFRDNRWIQVMYGVVAEWRRTIYLIRITIDTYWEFWVISSVGNFGWLSAPIAKSFGIVFYLVILALTCTAKDGSAKIMTKWDRLVIFGTYLCLTLMTMFSMINHTIMITLFGSESAPNSYYIREALYRIPYIGGIQGRYFVPFTLLFFMLFGSFEKINRKGTKAIVYSLIIVTYLYIGYVLLMRYWI